MTPSITTLQNLLTAVKRVADHQAEIKRLKGENFNLFSILGMETAENKTHSAFLGELLNPKGSHFHGGLFLQSFLDSIGYKGPLSVDTASLVLEKYIGVRNDQEKTGGRIDIYIWDKAGNTISIENKIYAVDQNAQIQRYANHNRDRNTVYYLTLEGGEASKESKGELTDGNGYHCKSYRHHIIEWLGKCMQYAVDQPILRESIKQYIILIKGLTFQSTENKMENEIRDLIEQDYGSATLIAQNIWAVEEKKIRLFLTQVKEKVEAELPAGKDWTVTLDLNLWDSYRGISITHTSWDEIVVRLQGESKIIGGPSIYGIVAHNATWDRSLLLEKLAPIKDLFSGFSQSAWWVYYRYVNLFQSPTDKARLFENQGWDEWVKEVAANLIEIAQACEGLLAEIPRIGK